MLARTLAVIALALATATSALAQGPLSPPDGSGPSATNYRGYTVLYLINGVRRHTTYDQETQIVCTNIGTDFVDWAVQLFNGSDAANLDCETNTTRTRSGESDVFATDSTLDNFMISGACPSGNGTVDVSMARVIAQQKKAAMLCTARIIDAATRNVVADLPATSVAKPPKIKIK